MQTLKDSTPKITTARDGRAVSSSWQQKPSEQDLVSFDTALTVSAMRYIRAIHCGRVNPKEFKFQLDMGWVQLSLAEFIQTQV